MQKFKSIYFVLMFVLLNSLFFYIGWNGWMYVKHVFQLENPILYIILFAILSYSYFFSRKVRWLEPFRIVGYLWLAAIQYSLILLPIADLSVYLLKRAEFSTDRAILIVGTITVAIFLFIYVYGIFNAYSPVIRAYQIKVPRKQSQRESLRIAMASDMHFGTLSGVRHLSNLVQKVEQLEPDLILLPGDIIDDDPEAFIRKKMGPIMGKLHAPLGVYGVLGNHEYYGGQIPGFLEEMKKANIRILQDETLLIDESFHLVGRKDKTDKKRKSFMDVTSSLDSNYPIIAMDHQPYELQQARESNVDILLCGHTHRGQMAPNHLITKKVYELDWGYSFKENLHAFVSSGYGFWGPPLRIGSRSEILCIDVEFIK